MKHFISLLSSATLALLVSGHALAQDAAYVTCSDGTVQQYAVASLGDVTFSADGTYIYLQTTDAVLITYPVAAVNSIEFVQPAGSAPQAIDETFDVLMDAADDQLYTEVKETIPTSETSTNDYGDFVENFEEDEESKGTVTITYGTSTVEVTYQPTSLKGKAVAVQSGSATDVVVYGNKKVDYVLKGQCDNGSFTLYSAKKSTITLDGLTLKNDAGAALTMPKKVAGSVEYGGKTAYIVLKSGTVNTLEDGSSYSSTIAGEDMKGAIFSEGQLIFSGNGTLNVKSNYGHGIASDDYIRVRGNSAKYAHCPVINIHSAKDGISTNDYFLMYGGRITIDAADDGIDVGKGHVDIRGGWLTVNSVDEGVMASYEGEADGSYDSSITPNVNVAGGVLKITTTGSKGMAIKAAKDVNVSNGVVQATVKGAGSKAVNADGNVILSGGKITAMVEGIPVYDEEDDDVSSAAGIRTKGTLTLGGATVGIKATAEGGKGINSVGSVQMNGGTLSVVAMSGKYSSGGHSSRARGVTADGGISVAGGVLRVRTLDDAVYVPEAATVSLTAGALHAFSTDGKALAGTVAQTGGWLVTR